MEIWITFYIFCRINYCVIFYNVEDAKTNYTNDVIKLIHISEKFTITQNFHIMICLFPFMFNLGQGQTSFENINVTLETIRFACLKASFTV